MSTLHQITKTSLTAALCSREENNTLTIWPNHPSSVSSKRATTYVRLPTYGKIICNETDWATYGLSLLAQAENVELGKHIPRGLAHWLFALSATVRGLTAKLAKVDYTWIARVAPNFTWSR